LPLFFFYINESIKHKAMPRFITLTLRDGKPVDLNVDMIGSIGEPGEDGLTKVGHLTHNNGGFPIKETKAVILKKIKESKNI
jgi:hypothetical protein